MCRTLRSQRNSNQRLAMKEHARQGGQPLQLLRKISVQPETPPRQPARCALGSDGSCNV